MPWKKRCTQKSTRNLRLAETHDECTYHLAVARVWRCVQHREYTCPAACWTRAIVNSIFSTLVDSYPIAPLLVRYPNRLSYVESTRRRLNYLSGARSGSWKCAFLYTANNYVVHKTSWIIVSLLVKTFLDYGKRRQKASCKFSFGITNK